MPWTPTSVTLKLRSIGGITLTCFARPPFPYPFQCWPRTCTIQSTEKPLQNNIGREKDRYQSSVTQVECP